MNSLRAGQKALQGRTSRRAALPESKLVTLLQRKDRKAFSVLYDSYAPSLYSITLKIVQISPLAEDVLQEAFVKIWRNIHQYDPLKGRLFTWLLNIVRHTAIDTIRLKQWQTDYKRQLKKTMEDEADQQQNYRMAVDHLGLETLLTQLTPEQYQLIEYLYFKGYTQVEVAQELAIPLGTVKTRTRMALNQLRKWAIPKPQGKEDSY